MALGGWEEYILSYFLSIFDHRVSLTPSLSFLKTRRHAAYILEKAAVKAQEKVNDDSFYVSISLGHKVRSYLVKYYSGCFYEGAFG